MRWVLALLLLFSPVWASDKIAEDDIRLELKLEPREHPPHLGEMVLLSITGTFKVPVVREKLRQSSLDGFDWMQLGEDRWYKEREDGFEVLKFERRMALFPQKVGAVLIEPFVHGLEVLNRQNQTVAVDEVSNGLTLQAVPQPDMSEWWFPVRRLEISDAWSNQPEALDPGAASLRVVSLTVEGTAPQRIPPMPELTGAGAFIFPHPEHRIVALGPNGPVTRVFWRWTVRPKEATAGYLNPIKLTYFDAEAREVKTISLSAQRVAYAGGPQEVMAQGTPAAPGLPVGDGAPLVGAAPRWAALAALVSGLLLGLGGIAFRWGAAGLQVPGWLRGDPKLRALRRAAGSGDADAVWRVARAVLPETSWPESLQRLDAALFAGAPRPDLGAVVKDVLDVSRTQA